MSNSIPPHMDPMLPDEVTELLSLTLHGDLPKHTMQRVFATLAAHNQALTYKRELVLGEVSDALAPYLDEMDRLAVGALGHVGVRSDRRSDSIRAALVALQVDHG